VRSRAAAILFGLAVVVVGGIWTFQGLGYIGGSAMSGQEEWSIIGPVVAGLGVALIIVVTRPRD
jgi:hypothetical protein